MQVTSCVYKACSVQMKLIITYNTYIYNIYNVSYNYCTIQHILPLLAPGTRWDTSGSLQTYLKLRRVVPLAGDMVAAFPVLKLQRRHVSWTETEPAAAGTTIESQTPDITH